jgi:hypothetical protein
MLGGGYGFATTRPAVATTRPAAAAAVAAIASVALAVCLIMVGVRVCVGQLNREVTQKVKVAMLVWIKTSWPGPGMVAGRRSAS